ncbi:MAG: ral secretion pathway protein [Phycisphaerales bacterium]|jgi:type II secretory ATPase GspE/PulE/Tfp pilus assembly ATPase PilB-like protein|nr:ral secretion pathway protein [Phycisphaerales bacterium]
MTVPHIDARLLIDQVLDEAVKRRASDVHLEPTADGLEIRLRVDGLLETRNHVDANTGRSMVTRLMVMAHLLTYRLDVPQEGRATVEVPSASKPIDLRLSIMPTTHGLRAAVRMPAELVQPRTLTELNLPSGVMAGLEKFASSDSGMLILTGPAGSGKTTTIYALLEHIAATSAGLSIVALEDPVERDIPGVTQIEVAPFGELTYERTLRSILRQDPQVLMLGEIRDGATASLAVQAALSGHRLVSTLHAASPAGAIARLLEMGVEPYQLTSAIFGIVSQRLLRRLLPSPGLQPPAQPDRPLKPAASQPASQYRGRIPVAEFVTMDDALRPAILNRSDAGAIEKIYARQSGFRPIRAAAGDCIRGGLTDEAEVRRVLGQAPAGSGGAPG